MCMCVIFIYSGLFDFIYSGLFDECMLLLKIKNYYSV